MRNLIFLILILPSIALFSQGQTTSKTRSIDGVVIAKSDHLPIPSAIVKLLNPLDSTLLKAESTKEDGSFRITTTQQNQILEVSYIGHHKFYLDIDFEENKTKISIDTIYLEENAILLKEAEVVADIPAMLVRGDTIEFNASAYHSDGSTVLKDLIKQIPGLEMDENGALKANGKPIAKILLDGKEYFGNDISMALSTLPANMITKLQLFEKESEEAKASGIRDKEPDQVLNLEVKEEFKKSIFGDTKSGVGNKGRHTNRLNVNKMHGDNQYSIVGNLNNMNDAEYSYGNNFDDNFDKSVGANFNFQESEKITVNGSTHYDNTKSKDKYISDSYSSILNQYTSRSGESVNKRQNARMNATIDWKPDSLTTIFLRSNASYNHGNVQSASSDIAEIVNKSLTSSTSDRLTKSDSYNFSNSLMISRKLNGKGRNIMLNFHHTYGKDESNGTNYSEKIYQENNEKEIIDQISKGDNNSTRYGISARYVEALTNDDRLYASYSISFNNSDKIDDVRKKDDVTGEYTLIDKDYARSTDSYSLRQNVRVGYQRSKEKYTLNISFSMDPSSTRNKTLLQSPLFGDSNQTVTDDYPATYTQTQSVINFSPMAYFQWKLKKDTHLDFNYYASTNHPSTDQLSAVVNINSPVSKTVGNPDLKPSFNNSWGVNFRKSDYESGRYFAASVNYSYTFDNVVSYQTVDDHSNTVNTYRNIDGNSSAYTYVTFNTPLKNKKINLGTTFNTSYSKNINFINSRRNNLQNISISPAIFGRFSSNFKKFTTDILETRINFSLNHTMSDNKLAQKRRSNDTYYRLSHYMKFRLPFDDEKNLLFGKKHPIELALESDLNFSYRTGLAEGVKKDETMWNLAISMLFLKDKRGSLKFEYFDVLDDLKQQENTISGSDYNNYWRKVINNYFIVSFSYRFNIF